MNIIKFTDQKGNTQQVEITQNKDQFGQIAGLSRRKAFRLARRKGWSHHKMYKGSTMSYPKLF